MTITATEKEFIYIKPPAYHFTRAAHFSIAAKVLENRGLRPAALQMKALAVYETALGFEAMVYRSSVKPA